MNLSVIEIENQYHKIKNKCLQSPIESNSEAFDLLLKTTPLKNNGKLHVKISKSFGNEAFCINGWLDDRSPYYEVKNEIKDLGNMINDNTLWQVKNGGFAFDKKLKSWCSSDPNVITRIAYKLDQNDGTTIGVSKESACSFFTGLYPKNFSSRPFSYKKTLSESYKIFLNNKNNQKTINKNENKKIKIVVPDKSSEILISSDEIPYEKSRKITSLLKNNKIDPLVSYNYKLYDPKENKYIEKKISLLKWKKIDGKYYLSAPVGLMENVSKFLNKVTDMNVEIQDNRKIPPPKPFKIVGKGIDGKPIKLRDYQEKIVNESVKNGHGLIELATGGGKTLIATSIASKIGQDTAFFVPNTSLFYNAYDQIKSYVDPKEVNIGQIGGEKIDLKDDPNKVDINIISIPMAYRVLDGKNTSPEKKKSIIRAIKMSPIMMVDEVHHLPANKYNLISKNSPSKYRFGFTATAIRSDGKELEFIGGVGNKIGQLKAMDLVKKGYLVPPKILIVDNSDISPINDMDIIKNLSSDICFPTLSSIMKKNVLNYRLPKNGNARQHYIRKAVTMCNEKRNDRITEITKELYDRDKTSIIFVNYVKHGEILVNKLNEKNINADLLTGVSESNIFETQKEKELNKFKKKRSNLFNKMKRGDLKVIVATGQIMGEGVDIPAIDSLVLADESKSKVNSIQRIGRALRLKPGKKKSIIVDFYDNSPMVRNWSNSRIETYKEEKFPYEKISYQFIPKKFNEEIGKAKQLSKSEVEKNKLILQTKQIINNLNKFKVTELKKIARDLRSNHKEMPSYSKLKKSELVEYLAKYKIEYK